MARSSAKHIYPGDPIFTYEGDELGEKNEGMTMSEMAMMLREYHQLRIVPIEEAVTELVRELRSIQSFLLEDGE